MRRQRRCPVTDRPGDHPGVRIDRQAGGQPRRLPSERVTIRIGGAESQRDHIPFGITLIPRRGHHRRPIGVGHRPGERCPVLQTRHPVVGDGHRHRKRRTRRGVEGDRAGDRTAARVDRQSVGETGRRPGERVTVGIGGHQSQRDHVPLGIALIPRRGDCGGPVGVAHRPGEGIARLQRRSPIIGDRHRHAIRRTRGGVIGDRSRDLTGDRIDREAIGQAGRRPGEGVTVGIRAGDRRGDGVTLGVTLVPGRADRRRPVGVIHRPGEHHRVLEGRDTVVGGGHGHRIQPGRGVGDRSRDHPRRRIDREPRRKTGRSPCQTITVGVVAHHRQVDRVALGIGLIPGVGDSRRTVGVGDRPGERHVGRQHRSAVVGGGHRHRVQPGRLIGDGSRDHTGRRIDP